jgi:regulator of sigma E protease
MFGTLLLFLVVLSLLVFVHEAGHFFMAKKMGMKVDEFGFGFPPRLWGIQRGGTTYSINWIPLGGFVKIKGESGEHRGDSDSFASKKIWQRLVVLVAGVVMNLLLACVLLSAGFMVGLPSIVDEQTPSYAHVSGKQVSVMTVVPGSPAEAAGIASGDTIVLIDGTPYDDAAAAREHISSSGDTGVDMVVKRQDGTSVMMHVVAQDIASVGVHGIGVGLLTTATVSFSPLYAMYHGAIATAQYTIEVVKAFAGLIRNLVVEQTVSVELSGPVGIAVMTGQAAAMGIVYLVQFAALLSINLAVLNVLPFPALDGGRVLFLVIEKFRGRPVDEKVEAMVHNLGFALLMILVALVTYRDFVKFGGQIIGTLKSLIGA